MNFQGEMCTLSFGMQFTTGHILLTGSIWFRRNGPVDRDSTKSARIPFKLKLTEAEFNQLRHWLSMDTSSSFQLPAPLRHLRRVSNDLASDVNVIELELAQEQLPDWWNWDVVFPLTVRLAIPPPEYTYLTSILNREHWSAELMW